MNMLLKLTFIFFSLVPTATWGCFMPNPEQTTTPEVLIKRTKDIYLAEVVANLNGMVEFKVVETIKGQKRDKFQVSGALSDEDETDFNNHKLKSFWEKNGGRVEIEPSCEIIPTFQKGKKYLVFLNKPYHLKSFELIKNDRDIWLHKVKKEINSK